MSRTVSAELLRAWAEHLCRARSSAPADLAEALGVPLDPLGVQLWPPPPGITGSRVHGGDIPLVELELADPLPLGEIDRLLGAGNRLPRVDWDRPHVIAFTIAVAGAPWRCVILASCDQPPAPATPVARVALRLDRA